MKSSILCNSKLILGCIILILVLEFLVFQDLPFFWDARSKYLRASWLYDHDFKQWVVPTSINSGHPPLWIWTLAIFWKLFGKTVLVARVALLLVNIGVFYQLFRFAHFNFPKQAALLPIMLLFLEPTLVAQTTNLGNDMLLLFFVLLGLNALQKNKNILYTIAIAGLLLTNLRGLYCVLAFVIIHFCSFKQGLILFNRKIIWAYVIGLIPLTLFLIYQYQVLDWVLFPQDNSYSGQRKSGSFQNTLKNSMAYIKMLLEFGRFLMWISLVYFGYKWFKNRSRLTQNVKYVGIVLGVFTGVFFIGFTPFTNPLGPRYLMIVYLMATLLCIMGSFEFIQNKIKRTILLSAVAISFITGHLWIYPNTIAQGWDSTLAYLHYFPLKDKMTYYLVENNIALNTVNTNLRLNYYLDREALTTQRFAQAGFGEVSYFVFSNIENKTTDAQMQELDVSWTKVQHYERMGVFITLYKKQDNLKTDL